MIKKKFFLNITLIQVNIVYYLIANKILEETKLICSEKK